MPLDPVLAQGITPINFAGPDPATKMNQLAMMMKMQGLQQEGQLNSLKLTEAQREMAEVDAMKDAIRRGDDLLDPRNAAKYGSSGLAFHKALRESQNADLDNRTKIAAAGRDIWLGINNQATYEAKLPELEALSPGSTRNLPRMFTPELKAENVMDAKAFLDQNKPQTEVGKLIAARDGLPPGDPNRATYDAAIAKANYIRPVNELDDNPGTENEIDLLANMFVKSGTMPPLGMGTNAARTRKAVFARAAEIANRDGGDMGASAENILSNKQTLGAQTKTLNAFASGQEGKSIRAINTAVAHLDTLANAASALKNKDVRLFNQIGNAISKEFGAPAPTDFAALKRFVAGELVKAASGTAGALGDREEISNTVDGANSPEQLAGVINQFQDLMSGQLNSFKTQYTNGTGRDDFDAKFLTPRAKEFLGGGGNGNGGSGGSNENPPPTEEDIAHTAKLYNMTPDQVRRQLGLK
jgi:hypothetical protein